jgi:hypothetical protein
MAKKGWQAAEEKRSKVSVYRPKYTVNGKKRIFEIWWYKFTFAGQVIRESSKSNSKTVPRDAERARRREMELAINRIPKREKTPLFASAADLWLAGKSGLAETSKQRYKECVAVLKKDFGKRLVCDFDGNDIAEYQRKRLADGLSGRTVNYEWAHCAEFSGSLDSGEQWQTECTHFPNAIT